MAIPVVLDVDTGIDDALAIMLALRSPELRVVGISCVAGNVRLDQVVRNTTGVLAMADAGGVPVAVGAPRPLARRLTTATFFHGSDGVGGVPLPGPAGLITREPADAFLVRTAREHSGALAVVALGPITNVALACRKDPRFVRDLARLVVMGGAANVPGNVTPAAEANAFNDPEALAEVLQAFGTAGAGPSPVGGARLTLVGLDVTMRTLYPAAVHDALAPGVPQWPSELSRTAHALLNHYVAADVAAGLPGSPLHDPLAVAILAQPALAETCPALVRIETSGTWTRGATVANFTGLVEHLVDDGDADDCRGLVPVEPNCHVALGVDAARFLDLFRDRLGLNAAGRPT